MFIEIYMMSVKDGVRLPLVVIFKTAMLVSANLGLNLNVMLVSVNCVQ